MTNLTDITNLTDADLDALLGMDDYHEDLIEEIDSIIAESRRMRSDYYNRKDAQSGYCRRGPNDNRYPFDNR